MNLKIKFLTVAAIIAFILLSCEKEESQTGTVTDFDGNTYNTVKIGNQWWMVENLKTTHYANGDAIPDGTGAGDISGETDPKYWFAYDDDLNNLSTYGRLYTWYTVTDSRNVCPDGWHLPNDDEWKELEMQLGMSQADADGTDFRGTDEGSQLAGTASLWNNGILIDNVAFAAAGFTAHPAGFRRNWDGTFQHLGYYTHWWTSTESSTSHAWYRELWIHYPGIKRSNYGKSVGFSVRCLKDN